jgi:hypothetical protein
MAVWPRPKFTPVIYRLRNPQSTLHLAALFHVSVSSGIEPRNGAAKLLNPLPYGRTALVEAPVKDFGSRSNLVVLLLTLTTMLGCSALNATSPAAQQAQGTSSTSGGITLNPKAISFGNVPLGKTQTLTATLSNRGLGTVTITHASISGPGFALTGSSVPLVLPPRQTATLGVSFTPATSGTNTGTISLTGTNKIRIVRTGGGRRGPETPINVGVTTFSSSLKIPVSGVGMASGQLAVSPASLTLGKVKIGASQTQSATLVNSGSATVTVKQATVTGRGFRMSGLSFPLTLSPGQRKAFSVTFTPLAAGAASGTVAVTSDAPNSVVNVAVSAVAVGTGSIISSPSSLSFGSVQVGKSQTLPATLTNSGSAMVTLLQAGVSGTGFTVSGLSLPLPLAPGQSTPYSVTFTRQSGGAATGSLSIVSDASDGSLTIPLSATPAIGGALSTSDSTLDFSSVAVGSSNTLSETLTNTGGASVTVTQANVSGTAFKVTGLSLPLTLNAGQSFTFGTVFAPTSGGSATGSISVISDASNPTLTISMAGVATVSGQLAVSPATLNFGSVTVGQGKSLSGSLTAGSSGITVTGASMSTSEFTLSGISFPVTLTAGKSVPFTVTFKPQSSGVASASASFVSNASNSSAPQSLTGSGTPAPQHSVALSWTASPSSSVVGYNIYRGGITGGPYSQISSMNADTTFTDSSVQSGQTYFYVTTAVDGAGKESAFSNQTQAVIPTP